MAEQLGKEFLKRFMKQVCVNVKNQNTSSSINREDIQNQLEKIKYAALKTKKRWLIEREIHFLESMISDVGRSVNTEIQELRREIESLQAKFNSDSSYVVGKDDADEQRNLLEGINEKLDILLDRKISRERYESDVTGKFGNAIDKVRKKKHLVSIEKRLAEIKKRYASLKKAKKNKRIDDIERKIKSLNVKIKR